MITSFTPSRRSLLTGAGALTLAACTPNQTAMGHSRKVGIQLYTVRAAMAQDLPGTLRRIRGIGYDEVEFAGYFNTPPADIKRLLDDIGLAAPSAHVPAAQMRDAPGPLIETAHAMGHEYLVMPWLPPEARTTLDQWRGWAEVCNRFAAQCRDAGLKFAYHNHDFEFQPIDGVLPYDVLLQNTDPQLVHFETDIYWLKKGGRDLLPFLNQHKARVTMCHAKDWRPDGSMTDVGQGQIDFAAIFAQIPFEHYFVENDDTTTPFESAQTSYTAMRRLLA
ncbi:MAG TPA: sugar phosphate isomerase/epimerase [Caulobacterales bacterium]|nr:sugar phosphate isomerase/epimerase [Caulobacterales bacterium]